jgi:Holliday junction resolvase RusA-like endonuclease
MITFKDFPIQTVSDKQLWFRLRGMRHLIPSKEYKKLLEEIKDWEKRNDNYSNYFSSEACLKLTIIAYYEYKRVFTVNNKTKKFDVQNRVNAIINEVARILGVDDSSFFEIIIKKRISKRERIVVEIEHCIDNLFYNDKED